MVFHQTMDTNVVLVKNMVCNRCVSSVESILQDANIAFQKVIFGEIHLPKPLADSERQLLKNGLEKVGFELIDSHSSSLIEKIKLNVTRKARNEVS